MQFGSVIRQIFYMRYPLLFGLVLAGLGPFSWLALPQLLGNVLIAHTWQQIAFLTVICLTMAMMLSAQLWIITNNGPARFEADWGSIWPKEKQAGRLKRLCDLLSVRISERYWNWSWFGTLIWLLVGLSLPITAIVYSNLSNFLDEKKVRGFPESVTTGDGVLGVAVGFVLFIVVLILTTFISERYLSTKLRAKRLLPIANAIPDPRQQDEIFYGFGNRLGKFLASSKTPEKSNGYAYVETVDGKQYGYLAPGHGQLVVFSAVLLALYAGLYLHATFWPGTGELDKIWLPTMFYAVLLLMFISLMFSATSFFVDLYRFPTLLILPVVLCIGFWRTDHYFSVELKPEIAEQAAAEDAARIEQKADRFEMKMQERYLMRSIPTGKASQRTLVVITAPGGGIHAAAWTARLLTGLQERYQPEFGESIGLISAVSGGSVGAMHYLNAYPELTRYKKAGQHKKYSQLAHKVFLDSTASSLESVGWGLAFPDLTNFVLPGDFFRIDDDRAITVERYWNQLLLNCEDGQRPTLRTWGELVKNKQLPGFVFNATEVESGRRVLFTTIPLESGADRVLRKIGPRSFRDLYMDEKAPLQGDIDITTCVRLSATFPYVFPSARSQNVNSTEKPILAHVVDGGYVDNEGIFTAVDWLKRLIKEEQHDFNRVVLIRIRHHPLPKAGPAGIDRELPPLQSGFGSAVFAPAKAVIEVRDASQIERGQIDAELMQEIFQDGKSLTVVSLDYNPGKTTDEPPLNWKLTPRQVATYEEAWQNMILENHESPGIKKLDEFFELSPSAR